jgi:lipoprotein-anchoring transpeptidase ErfK/SrfK
VAKAALRSGHGRFFIVVLAATSFLLLACLSEATPGLGVSGAGLVSGKVAGAAKVLGAAEDTSAMKARAGVTPAALDIYPANDAANVLPDAPITVRASSGTLGTVTLKDSQGAAVKGQAAADGTWATSELLRPSSAYTLTIAAIGPDGMATSRTSRFSTLKPKVSATYTLIPDGGEVGVGMPVIIQFDSAVSTKARRAEVEKRVKVTTVPAQPGAWGWLDDRQLMWRPRTFWRPGTKVTVSTPLHGVQTGDNKWVTSDGGTSFTVGQSMVSSVNMVSHTLTVRRDGKVVRTIPVSTGRPGPLTETRNGTKVIIERSDTIVMDSSTIGIPAGSPGAYKITTHFNLRLTWTGEFIHSAPWSVGAQGSQNVSHGCTNMSPSNADWMFHSSKMGDVVTFTGSNREFKPQEGIGVWVYTYTGWKAQSALV